MGRSTPRCNGRPPAFAKPTATTLDRVLPIVVERRAQREIEEARQWWIENRPAAPHAFELALSDAYDRIVDVHQ